MELVTENIGTCKSKFLVSYVMLYFHVGISTIQVGSRAEIRGSGSAHVKWCELFSRLGAKSSFCLAKKSRLNPSFRACSFLFFYFLNNWCFLHFLRQHSAALKDSILLPKKGNMLHFKRQRVVAFKFIFFLFFLKGPWARAREPEGLARAWANIKMELGLSLNSGFFRAKP